MLNEHFVAIKVDREERPDIDALYMRATHLMTGQGGWPMTVFLDADARPFHAGTYFPPVDSRGMPSFTRVLTTLADVWRTDRTRVERIAAQVTAALRSADRPSAVSADRPSAVSADRTAPTAPTAPAFPSLDVALPDPQLVRVADAAVRTLHATFDPTDGGFGGAPKFPPSMVCEFLLRQHARTGQPLALDMAARTLTAMARRGLYDQVSGGFARYSTDGQWVVPHFEKMLYDNALLARVYLHWWRATGDPLAERITRETLDFLLRELGTAEGGFASALDADSDPVLPGQQREGAFAVWTPGQVRLALGEADIGAEDARRVCSWLGITQSGTFEHGTSVPQLRADPDDPELWRRARSALERARAARPRPARDDKVVAAWNGLAIAALAEASVLLAEPRYLMAAQRSARLLLDVHRAPSGPSGSRAGGSPGGPPGPHPGTHPRTPSGWRRVSRDGRAGSAPVVLEDLGGMAEGLLALHQADGGTPWLEAATELLELGLAQHADPDGGFWDTAADGEPLLSRLRDPSDNATPSGWTQFTGALLTSAALTGNLAHRSAADASMSRLLSTPASEHARFFGWGLAVLEAMLAGPVEVAVVGDGPQADALHRTALTSTSPGLVVARGPQGSTSPELLRDRTLLDGHPAAYVCRNFACRAPTTDPSTLAAQISGRTASG